MRSKMERMYWKTKGWAVGEEGVGLGPYKERGRDGAWGWRGTVVTLIMLLQIHSKAVL